MTKANVEFWSLVAILHRGRRVIAMNVCDKSIAKVGHGAMRSLWKNRDIRFE